MLKLKKPPEDEMIKDKQITNVRWDGDYLTSTVGEIKIRIGRNMATAETSRREGVVGGKEFKCCAELNFKQKDSFKVDLIISKISVIKGKFPELMFLGKEVRIHNGELLVPLKVNEKQESCLNNVFGARLEDGFLSLNKMNELLMRINNREFEAERASIEVIQSLKEEIEPTMLFKKEIRDVGNVASESEKLRKLRDKEELRRSRLK
jgi:hypothetical protein